MWDKLAQTHGSYRNVLRDKVESLRGKFDNMRMRKGEIISQHYGQIKEVMNEIKVFREDIPTYTLINKVLITLLDIYAIRISAIQELRCTPSNDLTLDSLIGRLTTFEVSNFDNYTPSIF